MADGVAPDRHRRPRASGSSGTWGGCTTRSSYFERDPIHRRYHQDELTFRMVYAFTENFALPLSHDEVVHGKGSLLAKMPGDRWQQLANLRALYGYQYGQPGKKLLFMGAEHGRRDRVEPRPRAAVVAARPTPTTRACAAGSATSTACTGPSRRCTRSTSTRPASSGSTPPTPPLSVLVVPAPTSARRRGAPAPGARRCWWCANLTPVPRQAYPVGVPAGGSVGRAGQQRRRRPTAAAGGGTWGRRPPSNPVPTVVPSRLPLTLPPLGVVFLRPGSRREGATPLAVVTTGSERRSEPVVSSCSSVPDRDSSCDLMTIGNGVQLTEPVRAVMRARLDMRRSGGGRRNRRGRRDPISTFRSTAPRRRPEDSALVGSRCATRVRALPARPAAGRRGHAPQPVPELTRRRARVGRWAALGRLRAVRLSGLAGALLIAASAPVWYLAAPSWRLTVPGIPHPGTSSRPPHLLHRPGPAHGLGVGRPHRPGRAGADLAPRPARRRGRGRRRLVRPRAARPAAAQPRRLQLRRPGRDGQPGHRPHRQRPDVPARGDLVCQVDPIWRDAPAPYGPVREARQGRRRGHRARPGRGQSGASGPWPCWA